MCLSYNNRRKQQGIGLPATIFLVVILSIIVLAMGELTEQSGLGFGQDYHAMKAFYAAESGAQVALNRVFVGGVACSAPMTAIDFDSSGDNPGLNNCTASIDCTSVLVDGITYYTFLSTGSCGGGFEQAQRSIQVRASSN